MSPIILSHVTDRKLSRNLSRLFSRPAFEIHPVPEARTALVLARNLRYDLVLVGYPLSELALAEFLSSVHGRGSSCADTPILVLAEERRLAELAAHIKVDRVEAAAAERPARELNQLVSRLVGIAERAPSRLMVRLEARLGRRRISKLCQTQNISESGLFLRTGDLIPVGTALQLELVLPDDPQPIRTAAEVVRHSVPEVEQAPGIAVRFLDLDDEETRRISEHVRRTTGG